MWWLCTEPAGCYFSLGFNFIFHLRGLHTQQKHRTSRLPTKRLPFFFLPEPMLLMPTWYWCNKTRPDFYGNSLFFFAVYNIVRVETYPRSSNQWQFFVCKILWLFSSRKALGWWQYFYNYFPKKGRREEGTEEGKGTIKRLFLLYNFIYLCIFCQQFNFA